jgi:hypothetical protein
LIQAGAPLVEIGDPLNLEVVADLLSTDVTQIEKGAAVRIDGWGGTALQVTRVDPAGFSRYRRSESRSNGSVSRSVTAACETRGFAKCARALTPPPSFCPLVRQAQNQGKPASARICAANTPRLTGLCGEEDTAQISPIQ